MKTLTIKIEVEKNQFDLKIDHEGFLAIELIGLSELIKDTIKKELNKTLDL